jgi:quercetin dioxygenase-like cupin family protein
MTTRDPASPYGRSVTPNISPYATVLRVIEGVVCVALDEHDHILTPGDELTIPAGAPHRLWDAGDDEARFVVTSRAPAVEPLPQAA